MTHAIQLILTGTAALVALMLLATWCTCRVSSLRHPDPERREGEGPAVSEFGGEMATFAKGDRVVYPSDPSRKGRVTESDSDDFGAYVCVVWDGEKKTCCYSPCLLQHAPQAVKKGGLR